VREARFPSFSTAHRFGAYFALFGVSIKPGKSTQPKWVGEVVGPHLPRFPTLKVAGRSTNTQVARVQVRIQITHEPLILQKRAGHRSRKLECFRTIEVD
jgi:hypothetical protein